jgi:hypothetical protein
MDHYEVLILGPGRNERNECLVVGTGMPGHGCPESPRGLGIAAVGGRVRCPERAAQGACSATRPSIYWGWAFTPAVTPEWAELRPHGRPAGSGTQVAGLSAIHPAVAKPVSRGRVKGCDRTRTRVVTETPADRLEGSQARGHNTASGRMQQSLKTPTQKNMSLDTVSRHRNLAIVHVVTYRWRCVHQRRGRSTPAMLIVNIPPPTPPRGPQSAPNH